jgi:Zn-dependent metalloprotease
MAKTPGDDAPRSNGLQNYALHAFDEADQDTVKTLDEEGAVRGFGFAAVDPASLDPETVARRYLTGALASEATPSFVAPQADTVTAQFKVIGTETVPLTGTRTVKFRQTFHDIPVYGALVNVELDDQNALVSLTSALGEPSGVKPVARLSPADAAKAVAQHGTFRKDLKGVAPRVNYYYDPVRSKWRLVFIFEDVPVVAPAGGKAGGKAAKGHGHVHPAPHYMDYIVDAHTGTVVAELPRTPSVGVSESHTAHDGADVARQITVENVDGTRFLRDALLNVETFDFGFQDPMRASGSLPGSTVPEPVPPPWDVNFVSAHANAAAVATFLREVLKRNNIDDRGGPMNSAVNCVVASESPDSKQWLNAFWDGDQMVYGQVLIGNRLVSLAVALDIVAHEMFHGVTDNTSRLEYANQSGALNESYSDIFGMLIANRGIADPRDWEWRLGLGFNRNGAPFRDMADPTRQGQPAHMRNYKRLPNTAAGDYGGVHTNSGIHNKAAYNIMTAADDQGLVLTPNDSAAIFYVALTQYLSRTSQFSDSRRAVVTATRSLFRALPPDQLARRVRAVEAGFDAVGIK